MGHGEGEQGHRLLLGPQDVSAADHNAMLLLRYGLTTTDVTTIDAVDDKPDHIIRIPVTSQFPYHCSDRNW